MHFSSTEKTIKIASGVSWHSISKSESVSGPQVMTIHPVTIHNYDGPAWVVLMIEFQPSQCSCDHVITIWELGA